MRLENHLSTPNQEEIIKLRIIDFWCQECDENSRQ